MTDYLRSPVFQLKVVELILGLVAIFSIFANLWPSSSFFLTEVVHFTLYGFFTLNVIVIGGYFFGEPVSKFLILIVSLTGALFFLVSFIVMFVYYFNVDATRLLVSALASLLCALAYAGDSYYIIRFNAD